MINCIITRLNKIITENCGNEWEEEYRFQKANGDYAYLHDRGHIIYDVDNKACRIIGATLDITARKLVEMQLAEERESRQIEITAAVLAAQETERANIGRELHDNLNQILGATKLYVELAKTDEENRQMCLDKSSGYLVNVIEEIRRISKTLAPPIMDLMGLFDCIKILVHDLLLIQPIKIEFHVRGVEEKELNKKLQLDIYRIVQEQLNNILKHSKATQASISLTMELSEIVLVISDNGEGCGISKEKNGVGIINIKGRAELYGGRVMIASEPGQGYELKVLLPLNGRIE